MHVIPTEWKHFRAASRKAEGRVIYSPQESGDLIIFCPGFPGGGATVFEQRFSEALQSEEYTQVYLRHNGTRLDTDAAKDMLNTRQFPKAIPHHDGQWVGGTSSSVAEWLTEPQTVIEDIGANYTRIVILAHSFGAVAALNSLANLHEQKNRLLDRVDRILCLAPAVGLLCDHADDIMDTLWVKEFLESEMVKERVSLNGVEAIRDDLQSVYKTLAERVSQLPERIQQIYVHVERDEYVRGDDVEEFCKAAGDNNQFVIDRFERHDPRMRFDAHDMPNFPVQSLIELIEGNDTGAVNTAILSDGFIDE